VTLRDTPTGATFLASSGGRWRKGPALEQGEGFWCERLHAGEPRTDGFGNDAPVTAEEETR